MVYPNPNKGTFIIEFELQEMKDMGIKIYNAIGQQIYHRNRSKFIGKFKEQIDLRHLSVGIYLVTIEINDKKVVKSIVIE